MSVKLYRINAMTSASSEGIGKNSEAVVYGNFVSLSWGYVANATTSGQIIWIANETKTFASDNATVAKKKLNYTRISDNDEIEVGITWGTITQVDEGKFYNLSDADTVDWTTESTVASVVDTSDTWSATDPVIYKQLELVKFISSTKGIFKIVKIV